MACRTGAGCAGRGIAHLPRARPTGRFAGGSIQSGGAAAVIECKTGRLATHAAQAARDHWALAGTWLEVERAEYRLAMSWLQAGDAAQACRQAQACLDGVSANEGPALELFYACEAMARSLVALGDRPGAAHATAQADEAFAALAPDDRAACEASLQVLRSMTAAVPPD